jgi:hypothetical protein
MQTLYKDEAITIAPNLDGYLLSDFQHTLGDLSDGFWLERCATLYRYVDVCDCEFFSPHHGTFPNGMLGSAPPREITYHFGMFQSFQKFLNRSGAISVYRTVCMIVAHIVLEGSRVVPIIGELVTR